MGQILFFQQFYLLVAVVAVSISLAEMVKMVVLVVEEGLSLESHLLVALAQLDKDLTEELMFWVVVAQVLER
jgi:hypothetical protein